MRDSLAIEAGNDKTITCFNDTTILVAGTIFSQSENLVFEWTSDNPSFNPIDSLIFSVSEAGTYFLSVLDTFSFCEVIDSFVVDENIQPVVYEIGSTINLDCANEMAVIGTVNETNGRNYIYEWSTQDGNIISAINSQTAVADRGGLYLIEIEDIDNGCTLIDTQRVVDNRIMPIVDVGDLQSITCITDTLSLGGEETSLGTQFIYTWNTQDGQFINGEDSPFVLIAEPGTYTLTVVDTSNACLDSAFIVIMENKAFPELSFDDGLTLSCMADSLTILPETNEIIDDLAVQWRTDSGLIISDPNQFVATIALPGTYFIEVENINNRCISFDSITVADDRIFPTVTELEDRMLGCVNPSITLSAAGSEVGQNINYEWIDEQEMTLSNNTTLTINEPGLYVLQVTNQVNSCVSTDTVQISENFDPPTSGNFIIESPACDDSDNGFIEVVEVTGGTPPFRYALDNQDTSFVQLFPDLAPQSYMLTIIDDLDCPWDTLIQLQQPAAIDVMINVSDDELIMGEVATLSFETSIPTEDIADIIWSPADLLDCVDCESITTSFRRNTTIGLTLVDIQGCEGFATIDIDVDLAPTPNAITPNGDGSNDFFMIPQIELNPDAYPDSEMIIFNRWGDEVFSASPYLNDWDGNNNSGNPIPEGTYYYVLRLDTSEGELIRGDITIVRR